MSDNSEDRGIFDTGDAAPLLLPPTSQEQKEAEAKYQKEKERVIELARSDEEFDTAVKRAIEYENDPPRQEAMRNTQCFIRMYKDFEKNEFCDAQEDCALYRECKGYWFSVVYGYCHESAHLDEIRPLKQENNRVLRRRKPLKKPKPPKRAMRGVEYRPSGRPVDRIAEEIWASAGKPISLPAYSRYPIGKNKELREEATKEFLKKWGYGMFVALRISYHNYILDGKPFMRLWVSTASGGWLDLNKHLSKFVARVGGQVDDSPTSGEKWKPYPHRFWLCREKEVDLARQALSLYAAHRKELLTRKDS